jgi:hypothetical protein
MEHTVNNTSSISPNLHPIWQRHFGLQTIQPTKLQAKPRNACDALMRATQALVAAHPATR